MLQKAINMGNKRFYRKLSDSVKLKISLSLKGKSKTEKHKQAISKGMVNYWKTIPKLIDD